jgi:hypothetical protein
MVWTLAGVSPNPWDAIAADMNAKGDGNGDTGQSFHMDGCFEKYVTAGNMEAVQLQSGDQYLPPYSTP